MKRFFVTSIDGQLCAIRQPQSEAVLAQLQHAAHVRGIEAEVVLPTRKPLTFAVVGERLDLPGWDADGAPTAAWPAESLPWFAPIPRGAA